jgi:flagellar biosynthetic protein FliQ
MTTDSALELMRNLLLVVAQVAGPAIFAALAVGLVVGVLQTATQINEASISFVAKLLAVILALVIAGPFVLSTMVEYTRHCILSVAELSR